MRGRNHRKRELSRQRHELLLSRVACRNAYLAPAHVPSTIRYEDNNEMIAHATCRLCGQPMTRKSIARTVSDGFVLHRWVADPYLIVCL